VRSGRNRQRIWHAAPRATGERHAPGLRAMGAAGEAVPAKPLGAGRGKHREGRGVGDKAALFFPKLQGDGTGNARGLARHLPRVGASAAGEQVA